MKISFLLATLSVTLLPAGSAYADRDDRDHERGHKHKSHHREVFVQGPCRIERTWKKNGDFKEKRECKGAHYPAHVVVSRPPGGVHPPWFGQSPRPHEYPQSSRRQAVYQCDSATGAAILGGILGGAIGNQVGKGDGRTVATVGGAIAGVLIGGEIGRRMDPTNQACIAQALEVAPAGGRLDWSTSHHPHAQQYVVVPGHIEKRGNTWCRPYTATIISHGREETVQQVACRQPDGIWYRHG